MSLKHTLNNKNENYFSVQLTRWGPPLSRCCPASSKSRGLYSSPLTGPDSLWWQRVCCCTCRSVEEEHCVLQLHWFYFSDPSFHVFWRLFQPLSWQQPYVPVLSRGMLDFVMAPTAFLMGCHISHYEEVAAVSATIHPVSVQATRFVSYLANPMFLGQDDWSSVGCFGILH